MFLSDYGSYLASIKKLRDTSADALCIAHVGILTGKTNISDYLSASLQATGAYRERLEKCLAAFDGDIDRVVEKITAEEYDSRSDHLLNREPFITNLRAKINAVMKLEGS